MEKIVTYMGRKIATVYKGKYVASWEDLWLPKRKGARVKTQAWTKGPKRISSYKASRTVQRYGEPIPQTISAYPDPMSGGVFDPDAEKSLGRWIGKGDEAQRYYSKRTKDVAKGAAVQDKTSIYMLAGTETHIPEGDFYTEADGADYGLECMEESYQYYDADAKQVKYMPQWKPRYTDEEKEERRHWRRSIPTEAQVEVEELGDYGYVEEDY